METKSLLLELNNLEGEKIWQKININDSKPEQSRYEVGKTICLRVDETFTQAPYCVIEGAYTRIKWRPFIIWLACLAALVFYYYFSYNLQSAGQGWCFLTLMHPLISCTASIGISGGIARLINRVIVGSPSSNKKAIILKFRGRKALAKVAQVKQTNIYINHQPQVKFHLEFVDQNGFERQVVIKKVVSFVNIGGLGTIPARAVIYDPNNPYDVMLEEDLNKNEL